MMTTEQRAHALRRILSRMGRTPTPRQRAAARRLGCLLNGAPERSARATYREELTSTLGTARQEQAYIKRLRIGCRRAASRVIGPF